MTEERIQNAAETIHSANKLSITKGILNVIAAEARKEGRETLQKLYDNLKGAYREEQQWAIKLKIELAEKTAQMLQAEKAIKLALGKCPFPVGAMKAKEALESVCAERLKEGG